MARQQKISAVDTAWLRMDTPGNAMMICGVLLLRDRVTRARIKSVIEQRFLRFPRFRQRPVDEATVAMWQQQDDFDIDRHVLDIDLPAPGGQRELQALASRLASTALDPSVPRWQFHLVRNYGRGSALIVRIHHCYADGIALIQVMLSMTDETPRGPPALPLPQATAAGSDVEGAPDWLPRSAADVISLATSIGSTVVHKGVELWSNPTKAVDLAQQGTSLTREIATLALMREDSRTRLKGIPSGRKHAAWAKPLPLDEVKAIGRALGASVNDVVLACAAGAIARYLAGKGDRLEHVTLRVLVPVNLRPPHQAHRLGNQFGLVFVELPLSISNPLARLYAIRGNMRALKGSMQPVLALGLLAAMGAGPEALQAQLLQALARNATAVMTNVPGPQRPLYLAGALIESLMFWVPQAGNIAVGASIISYDGKVQFGLIVDHAVCGDPAPIVEGFAHAFDTLVLATLLSPWPSREELDPAVVAAACGVTETS